MDILLVEAASGRAVWAETFERRLRPSDANGVRNEVANRVAPAMAEPYGAIQSDRARDADGRAPEMLGSDAAVLLFYAYWRTSTETMIEAVRVGLERAVAAETDYAEALACLSLVYSNVFRFRHPIKQAAADPATGLARLLLARSSARQARAGRAMRSAWPGGSPAMSPAASRRWRPVAALNPNDTTILADLGQRYAMLARWDHAVALLAESCTTNPAQPDGYRIGLFLFHYAHGRYAEALNEARRIDAPGILYGHVAVAAAPGQLGLDEVAADAVAAIRALDTGSGAHVVTDLQSRHVAPDPVQRSSRASRRLASRCARQGPEGAFRRDLVALCPGHAWPARRRPGDSPRRPPASRPRASLTTGHAHIAGVCVVHALCIMCASNETPLTIAT